MTNVRKRTRGRAPSLKLTARHPSPLGFGENRLADCRTVPYCQKTVGFVRMPGFRPNQAVGRSIDLFLTIGGACFYKALIRPGRGLLQVCIDVISQDGKKKALKRCFFALRRMMLLAPGRILNDQSINYFRGIVPVSNTRSVGVNWLL